MIEYQSPMRRRIVAIRKCVGAEKIREEEKPAERIVDINRIVIDHHLALTAAQAVYRDHGSENVPIICANIQSVGGAETSRRRSLDQQESQVGAERVAFELRHAVGIRRKTELSGKLAQTQAFVVDYGHSGGAWHSEILSHRSRQIAIKTPLTVVG